MSYRLADGSMSTDYKIGDEFHVVGGLCKGLNARLIREDYSKNPWFATTDYPEYSISWSLLVHGKASKHSTLVNQLRETIKQIERTIEELES
jgi:hypothetical protein